MRLVTEAIREKLETDFENISTANGYRNTIAGSVFHNNSKIGSENRFPYLRYFFGKEVPGRQSNDGVYKECTVELTVIGEIKSTLDTANTNLVAIAGESLKEDLKAYFFHGDWITAGKTCNLTGTAATHGTAPVVKYGAVIRYDVTEISQFEDGDKAGVTVKLEVKFYEKLT